MSVDRGDEVSLDKYTPNSVKIEADVYRHKENRVDDIVTGAKVTKVKYADRKFQYYSGGWKNWSTQDKVVYLIYERQESDEELTTIKTIDSTANGVSMKMVDLWGDYGAKIGKTESTSVDFGSGSGYGSGNIKYNLLKPVMGRDGYPVISQNGASLSKIFGGIKEVNHLFSQKIYNQTGYYEYSSFENYAYLGENSNFTVYNQLGTPRENDEQFFFNRGNFMPYNRIVAGRFSENRNLYDEDGRRLSFGDPRYNEKLYFTDGTNNYQFGMHIEAEFTQQRDGMATHNMQKKPMVYEFNGDDDLWVFIDGVLVLDIGGVHDAHSGKIDFSTGYVTWYDHEAGDKNKVPKLHTTTIKEMFREAGKFPDGTTWIRLTSAQKVAEYFEGNTFVDYSHHNFQMFYLERGGGASNLHVKFNLPVVPKNTVNVQKVVQDKNGNDVNYAEDIDFKFEIEVNGQKYAEQSYKIIEDQQVVGEGKTDVNAQFTLKHNQTARFEGIEETCKYRVKELGAYLNGYKVEVNGTNVWTPSEEGEGERIPSADSGELSVATRPTAVFTNILSNSATLEISKELAESGSSEELNKEFLIQLRMKEKVYQGSYTIGNETYKAENGVIKLKAGQTAKIAGLPYGVVFDVKEMIDGSYVPTYQVTGKAENIKIPVKDENGVIINNVYSASAQMNGDCQVKVTNKKVEMGTGVTHVKVTKEWDESLGSYELPSYVEVTLYKDVNSNGELDESDEWLDEYATQKLTADNNWTAEWKNLPADTNYVVEEEYPPGYELIKTHIDNKFDEIVKVGGRLTPNSNPKHNIGRNNIILVKETGNHYFLWTPVDLKLDADDIEEIVAVLNNLGLEGAGNLNSDNISYKYGPSEQGGIHLNPNENGWTLSFDASSDWAMFWNFSYTRTQVIELTNSLDSDAVISLWVEKLWIGDSLQDRPESITVQLYQNGKEYRAPVIITKDFNREWTYEFTDLPIYTKNSDGSYTKNIYTVKEIKIGEEEIDSNGMANGYQSSVVENEDNSVTILNTKGWQIVKISENSTDNQKIYLEGAVFKLENGNTKIYGSSDKNGVVHWYQELECQTPYVDSIPEGTYTLSEEKAPMGYVTSKETWTIIIDHGYPKNIFSNKDGNLSSVNVDGKATFYYKNAPVYDLPEAGGNGIYWYMVGGVLLLTAAGMLILYKSRRKEVLES